MGRKDKNTAAAPIIKSPPPADSSSSSDDAISATSSQQQDAAFSSSDDDVPNTISPPPSKNPHSSAKQPTSSSDDDDVPNTVSTPSKTKPASKQPRSKPIATNPAPSSKRPAENDKASEKRAKKHKSEPTKPDPISTGPPTSGGPSVSAAMTPQKALFQRVWSDEDELVILKGMIEYKGKKGIDPMTNVDDFLDFIKKSLHVVDANKAQIVSKVRRLKRRFVNAQKKKLTDPHEIKAFELSKIIWLGPELDDNNAVVEVVQQIKSNGEVKDEEGKVKQKGGYGNVDVGEAADVEFGFSGVNGVLLREGMKRMGEVERGEMKRMMEKADRAYLEAYLLRLKVMEFAAKKMMDDIRNDQP